MMPASQPVLVLCMKWGKAYGPEYVNRLRNGVARHLSYPHRFICFTDDVNGIDPGIETFPLPDLGLPPEHKDLRWRKLAILGKDVFALQGTALFLDLDLVVVDSLEPFFDYPGKFLIIRDMDLFRSKPLRKLNPERDRFLNMVGNSSVFRMEMGAHSDVLEEFVRDPVAAQSAFKISQQFMSDALHRRGLLEYWPREWCVSFKNDCIPRYWRSYFRDPFIPKRAKIVVFAGNLKMQDVVEGRGSTWYRRIGNIDWLLREWR
ncbi:MAG: hypothetical protein RL001_1293 [Pseudomonadota bacterium]